MPITAKTQTNPRTSPKIHPRVLSVFLNIMLLSVNLFVKKCSRYFTIKKITRKIIKQTTIKVNTVKVWDIYSFIVKLDLWDIASGVIFDDKLNINRKNPGKPLVESVVLTWEESSVEFIPTIFTSKFALKPDSQCEIFADREVSHVVIFISHAAVGLQSKNEPMNTSE